MTNPSVSVLMPVYNAERYVAEAVESILAQTFTDFEFLIVDDGSTDGSLAILQRYTALDGRIRLTSRANTGYVAALNEMLAAARGELIARMDADDVCLSGRFEKQVAYLKDNGACIAVGTLVELIDADGDKLCDFLGLISHSQIDEAHLSGTGGALAHPSLLARRAALVGVGGYHPEFYPAEDVDLFLRLGELGLLANVPERLLRYRRHLDTTGHVHHLRQLDAVRRAVAAARARRGLPAVTHVVPALQILSPAEQHRTWSWWALGSGQVQTARKHARIALRRAPLSKESWRVMACAIRGR